MRYVVAKHFRECIAKRELEWELTQGVKEYIQKEAARDPYYALATGAIHGAPVDYSQSQPFVEEVVRRGPEAWLDPKKNAEFLNTPLENEPGKVYKYRFSRTRAPVLAELSQCYVHNMDMGMSEKNAAQMCARQRPIDWKTAGAKKRGGYLQITGMGRKGIALMREYLGDEDAVALDRQVYKFLVDKHGFIPSIEPRKGNHGISIPDKVQMEGEYEIKKLAQDCGVKPVEIQVAAWLWGACESRTRERKKHRGRATVWLGPGKTIDCADRAEYYKRKGIEPP